MPLLLLKRNKANLGIVAEKTALPNIRDIFSMGITFLIEAFAFIFFRAETVGDAFAYIAKMCSISILAMPKTEEVGRIAIGSIVLSIFILITVEWINRKEEYGFKRQSKRKVFRWLTYSIIALMIIELMGQQQGFIYFQF
jgi:hypothetical protein